MSTEYKEYPYVRDEPNDVYKIAFNKYDDFLIAYHSEDGKITILSPKEMVITVILRSIKRILVHLQETLIEKF